MSKLIKVTEDTVDSILANFTQWLRGTKITGGKLKYEHELAKVDQRATLFFTADAYAKMQYLIGIFGTEVAWHGVVHRVTDGKSDFVVTDILVYPQEVTGATVNTDQTKYQEWLAALDDDVFNNLRFQGHSHVNMGTSPSSTDLDHQERLLEQVDDSMFYIFVIWNKKNERTIKIYDMVANIQFDTADVDVKILENDETGFLKLMADAREMITEKKYTYNNGYWSGSSVATRTAVGSTATGKNVTGAAATPSAGTKAVQVAAANVSPASNASVRHGYRADGVTEDDYAWESMEWMGGTREM